MRQVIAETRAQAAALSDPRGEAAKVRAKAHPTVAEAEERSRGTEGAPTAEGLRLEALARQKLQLQSLQALQQWEAEGRPVGAGGVIPLVPLHAPLPLPPQLTALAAHRP